MAFPLIKLKEVLTESKVEAPSSNSSKRIRVRLHAKGVEKRPEMNDKEGATKYYIRRTGQFVYGRQNLHKGAFGVIPPELDGFQSSSDIPSFDVAARCLPEWVDLFLKQGGYYLELSKLASGVGSQRISPSKFLSLEMPLPSIEQQRAILAQVEFYKVSQSQLLFELSHQQTLLEKLRQQILQEAIEGKLTTDWRVQNPDVEPASELLERIAAEKAQLVKDKKIKKGKKQPPSESFTNEIRYPEEWELPDLDDISIHITDGTHQTPTYTSSGRIFLSAQNVKPFRFIPEVHKYVSEEAYQKYIKNRAVEKGDLVLGRVGAGIGETAVVDVDIECAIYVSLGLVKTFKMHTDSDYLAIVFNSPYGVSYAKGNISSGGGSAGNFNLGRIRSFPIPLPSFEEQKVIVAKVGKLLALCDRLETQITQNQNNAEQLMQAVLKEAFSHNSEAGAAEGAGA